MSRRGNLAIFESSSISKTGGDTLTKIDVHTLHINTRDIDKLSLQVAIKEQG